MSFDPTRVTTPVAAIGLRAFKEEGQVGAHGGVVVFDDQDLVAFEPPDVQAVVLLCVAHRR